MDLRKADVLSGIAFMVLGAGILIAALTSGWDLAAVQQSGWYTAPGMIPAGAAAVLMLQGALLIRTALKRGGRWRSDDLRSIIRRLRSAEAVRGALVAGLFLVYVFGLLGRVPFWMATFAFTAAFMRVFRAGAWWAIVLAATAVSGAAVLGFEVVAGIPLP